MEVKRVYLIIWKNEKGKQWFEVMVSGHRSQRIPAKWAEEFLPLMVVKMHDEQYRDGKKDREKKQCSIIKKMLTSRTEDRKKVFEIFTRLTKEKNKNKLKWWFTIYFPGQASS